MNLPDIGHSPAVVAMNKLRNSVRIQLSWAGLCRGPFETDFSGLGWGLYSKISKYKRLNPVGQVNHLAKGPPLRKLGLPVGRQIYLKPWYRARRNKYISLPEFLPMRAVSYRITDMQLLKLTHFSEFLRRAWLFLSLISFLNMFSWHLGSPSFCDAPLPSLPCNYLSDLTQTEWHFHLLVSSLPLQEAASIYIFLTWHFL